MKTQEKLNPQSEQDFSVLSKRDLLLVKTTILLFGTVLNICLFNLL